MSKAMIRENPERRATATAPATPPAGPEKRLSLGANRSRGVKPPALVITRNRRGEVRFTSSRNASRTGVRQALTTAVPARGSSLIIGASPEERLTEANPVSSR
jgi:hypothetical protein